MGRGELVELICSDNFAEPYENRKRLLIRCLQNQTFILDYKRVLFSSLACESYPDHTARRTGLKCNNGNGTLAEVGFAINKYRFLHVFNVCLNENSHSTYYTHFRLTPANNGHQRSFPRPDFMIGDFFRENPRTPILYTRRMQRLTLGQLLGKETAERLFNDTLYLYMARGHLMAKADAILGNHQRATFYYINAAPQWQPFNAGNWATIENRVRQFVDERNLTVEVYTGTFDVLSLPDCNGNLVELYLDIDKSTHNNCTGIGPFPRSRGRLPVPKFYYKILLSDDGRGVVFVGLNNPHATNAEIASRKYDLCPDVSNQITWMEKSWNRTNLFLGYSYACDVNSFVKVVNHLPGTIAATKLLI